MDRTIQFELLNPTIYLIHDIYNYVDITATTSVTASNTSSNTAGFTTKEGNEAKEKIETEETVCKVYYIIIKMT